MARGFNAGLRDLVARLDGGLGGGTRVVYGDVYGAVADVLADPAAHGFEDVGVVADLGFLSRVFLKKCDQLQ